MRGGAQGWKSRFRCESRGERYVKTVSNQWLETVSSGATAGAIRYLTAFLSAAARSVRSHVNSVAELLPFLMVSGVRPKWPYADVAE